MIARYDVIIIADMIAMIIAFRHARTHVLQFGTGSNAASLLCQNCAIIANSYRTSLHKVGSCAMIVHSVDASQGQGQAPASYRRQWKPWKRGRNAGKKIMSTWNGI